MLLAFGAHVLWGRRFATVGIDCRWLASGRTLSDGSGGSVMAYKRDWIETLGLLVIALCVAGYSVGR